MRLATFADHSNRPRFGVVRGDKLFDIVALAGVFNKPIPGASVKEALTSGPKTLASLGKLVDLAESRGVHRPIAGVRFLPPIPDPSKFFCVGKNNKRHREELAANKMLTEVPVGSFGTSVSILLAAMAMR